MTVACRFLGHRWRFWRDGATVRWDCRRGCSRGGAREYENEFEAARHLRHYAREAAPPVGFLMALAGAPLHRRPPSVRRH